MMELLLSPWPWYVAGPMIALVMFLLLYFGSEFGMSSNLRTMCSIGGGGRFCEFFDFDSKKQYWNLAFVLGSMIGGFLTITYMTPDTSIALAEATVQKLNETGFTEVGEDYLPAEIFGADRLTSTAGIGLLLVGGFLIGFGARYAGGCTSGHAISGLSNLQLPSLIAVVGFFIGGLTMVHLLMPLIF